MVEKCSNCDCVMKYYEEKYGATYICPICGYGFHETYMLPTPEDLINHDVESVNKNL